ncbi:membrane fusion protein, multidrug efflux system [Octadecabacter temperatus]|uniref:Toluene efflux pump periplasmic linker protein TtgD n=1 Tax=Octadecabacter temperatus TaxID=1458307 RepID=A0A0K0Y424_9RHOB|nr:efflux RND transporter periplasmic adaptor subunit [Octadecabacter temperatus]AKS45617.1 Toluene efflux pump periplasmic linker protein TtgD precursor [Octadecabacter temperatus]SIN96924.1 membrane fusion protein, multidrug efflux system [Octadecabacter temperatus]
MTSKPQKAAKPETVNPPVVEDPKAAREQLTFTADSGASRSTWFSGILVLVIVGWMGSGFIFPSEDTDTVTAREEPAPVAVAVETSVAEVITQFYQAEGQALPDRDTMMRAETSGDIAEVLVRKGQDVSAGDVIARFDPTSNQADANRVAEDLASAERELQNAQQLLERGVATADRVVDARASLASVQAEAIAIEQAADALTITAPFDGRIEALDLDEGEFVSAGTEVGRLVDITPLTVAIQVPQQSLTRLSVGQPATVRFITGEERTGTVTFVGTSAAAETRTFLAEVEVENDDGAIPAGISAEVIIPTGEATAHFLSPSIVSLSAEGELGVKTVNSDDVVEFYAIQVVKAQIDGIWVTGLPESVDIITVGQGFVNETETVAPSVGEQS